MNRTWNNSLAILDSLNRRGVAFRLNPDTAEFEFKAKEGILTPEERAGVKMCNLSLTRALRLREGLCVTCGMDAAKRPNLNGRAMQVIGAKEDDTPKVGWVDTQPSEKMQAKYPRMYCDSCWMSGAYLRMIGEKTSAKSRAKAPDPFPDTPMVENETLFED